MNSAWGVISFLIELRNNKKVLCAEQLRNLGKRRLILSQFFSIFGTKFECEHC